MGVGIHTVPMHQVLNGWCLGTSNRQILFDFGFDLLSRRHGKDRTLLPAEFEVNSSWCHISPMTAGLSIFTGTMSFDLILPNLEKAP